MKIRILLVLVVLSSALIAPASERVLVPIAGERLTEGAAGSIWETTISLTNISEVPVLVQGYTHPAGCIIALCQNYVPIPPHQTVVVRVPRPGTSNSSFLYVEDGRSSDLAATERIRDLSRGYQTWGTTIPIVPEGAFTAFVAINDVPIAPEFRNLLRVYGSEPADVEVRLYRINPERGLPTPVGTFLDALVYKQRLNLTTSSAYAPAMAQLYLDAIPGTVAGDRLRVEIQGATPSWAFVSTTHNETQHVTIEVPMIRAVTTRCP